MRLRRRSATAAAVLAAALALAACGDADSEPDGLGTITDPEEDEDDDEPVAPEPGDDDADVDGTDEEPIDDGADGADGQEPDDADGSADGGDADGGEDGDADDGGEDPAPGEDVEAGAPPLPGDGGTGQQEVDGDGSILTVTDVRLGQHDGFTRVVIEVDDADGRPGYFAHYVDEPQQQGSGDLVEVAGTSYLEVLVRGIAMPFDRPEGVTAWEAGRASGPSGGVVAEVVDASLFEGQQQFFIGLDGGPFDYRIDRLSDPERIVIDVVPRL